MKKVKIGIIGCGVISKIYLENCTKKFDILEVEAVADIDIEKAKAKAEQFNIRKVCTVDEMLSDPEIQIIVNLTIPKVHAEINLACLEAGKHIYSEKPFALTLKDGSKIIEKAKSKDLLVGSAPDTFMGAGLQTCRKVIDDGWIGKPLGVTAFYMSPGNEYWHPDPEFFYKEGAGPMFDMGPYYFTTFVNLIGPIRRVASSTRITYPERKIETAPKYGQTIKVDVPTYIAGVLDFKCGAVGTFVTTFDVWGTKLPFMEIYGTSGTLIVPDPNNFGGPIYILRRERREWEEIPLLYKHNDQKRGLGVVDMAYALLNNRPHRANGDVAYHVLEIMHAFHDASREGKHCEIQSTCRRPLPLPMDLFGNTLD